jgi:hypothetical protein
MKRLKITNEMTATISLSIGTGRHMQFHAATLTFDCSIHQSRSSALVDRLAGSEKSFAQLLLQRYYNCHTQM